MLKRIRLEVWPFIMVIICLAVLVVYPLWKIMVQAFLFDGMLSFESIHQTWSNPSNQLALRRSLTVSSYATLFSVTLGVFLAWVVTRTNIPHAGLVKSLLMTPMLIPPFVGAIAWVQLLGPVGYVNKFLMWITGSEDPIFYIYGPVGIIIVMALHSYPMVFLVTSTAFQKKI